MDVRPTNSEIEILGVLWERGPSSVREVHEVLHTKRGTGYTTVLKLMQIMVDKGLLRRDEESRAHIYAANIEEAAAKRNLVSDLAERAFGGSALRLALHALGSKPATPEELAELRRVLSEMEEQS